jgi:excisionase family DNA binding protein
VSVHTDLRRRSRQAASLQHALYRNELAEMGRVRREAQAAALAAERRIAESLPPALNAGVSIVEAARITGLSRPTIYKMLESGGSEDARTRAAFEELAGLLAEATAALGRDALLHDLAERLEVDQSEAARRLMVVGPYGWRLAELFADQQLPELVDRLARLPNLEKVVASQALLQKHDLVAIAASVHLPQHDVAVQLSLAAMRLLATSW